MNWDAIGAIGEILGAAAVFASLVYLAVQTKQNTRALKSAAFHQIRSSFSEVSLAVVQDPSLVSLLNRVREDDPDLTTEDAARFTYFLTTFLRRGESAYFQSSQGALEYESWLGIKWTTLLLLDNRYGQQFWDTESNRFTTEFVKVLNEAMNESSSNLTGVKVSQS